MFNKSKIVFVIAALSLIAVSGLLIGARPEGERVNLVLQQQQLQPDTVAFMSYKGTSDRFGYDARAAQARVQMNLTLFPATEEGHHSVSGRMTLITPGQRAFNLIIGESEFLYSALVDGELIYYGRITGSTKTNTEEDFGSILVYNATKGTGGLTLATGALETEVSLLPFGDSSLLSLYRHLMFREE